MVTNLKYVFIGGSYRGYKVFMSLVDKAVLPSLFFILKEDDHEENKYSELIEQKCIDYSVEYRICKKLNNDDYSKIKKRQWDFGIVCGWRTIIDLSINKYFKAGLIAAHDSLLPNYRGFAPLNWSIINGESKTGVTLFQINDGNVDSGDIINQTEIIIEGNDYAIDVYEKITTATVELIEKFIYDFKDGTWSLTPQDESLATYTCKRTPEDGKINWDKSSKDIYNLIRGLATPYPGAYCVYNNRTFHIQRAIIGPQNNKNFIGRISGKVISILEDGIEILCGSGTIVIQLWEDKENHIVCKPSEIIKSISVNLK